ncbi:hypothetical protein ABIF81_006565 [Bradyrhizobium daqingense]
MKYFYFAAAALAIVTAATPSLAQKPKLIGKCMRTDCAAMQSYCEESKSTGKTGTDCGMAGKQCVAGGGKSWLGRTPDGKAWSCTF